MSKVNGYELTNADKLNNEYFEWMYQLVCNDKYYKNLSFRKLLYFLHSVEFIYVVEMDVNRAIDGVDFRYRFGYECGYSREVIEKFLDTRPCSVLEMMIALAFRVEEHIMDDPDFGDRTGQWFWNMIVNLGLGTMNDSKFDQRYCEQVIFRFLNREYERNGKGGLFTIHDNTRDMRTAEIWYQTMWYLNDFLDN